MSTKLFFPLCTMAKQQMQPFKHMDLPKGSRRQQNGRTLSMFHIADTVIQHKEGLPLWTRCGFLTANSFVAELT